MTLITQTDPAAKEVPQVLVWEKSPLMAMLVIVKLAFPVLLTVTACGALMEPTNIPLKLRLLAESEAMGAVPTPLKLAVCGLPDALSVTESDVMRVPVADGVNATEMVQLAPADRLLPHLLVCEKSFRFPPVSVIFVILRLEVPVFVSVIVCLLLVVPTVWLPKLMLIGESVATG
jgi:hypothetical protein